MWGATAAVRRLSLRRIISIHAPRVGSDTQVTHGVVHTVISIHAPRVGSDLNPIKFPAHFCPISIHAPRVGSDLQIGAHRHIQRGFQSTLPVWGATVATALCMITSVFQSTLPVWGATTLRTGELQVKLHFNPRSPCGERQLWLPHTGMEVIFQSTLPVWGATRAAVLPD